MNSATIRYAVIDEAIALQITPNFIKRKITFLKKGVAIMVNFPDPIRNLPKANIPLKGIHAFLSQGNNHQIIFMEFSEDVDLPEHSHESQWGIVLEGEIELVMDGIRNSFKKGDRYFIPKGVRHSGKIFAGYADITFFDQKDRYDIKK